MNHHRGGRKQREARERRLSRIAEAQEGVFSRDQALEAGLTRRMIERRIAAGRWERVHPRVYRIAGVPQSWRQELVADVLAWGEGTVSSHRSAGALWTLAGCEPGGSREVAVPAGRKRARRDGLIVHRTNALPRVDVTSIGGIPVTTVARTLIDLASVVPIEAVEEALDDALRRRLVTLSRVRRRLSELSQKGRPGIKAMRALLDARDPAKAVPDSVLETRLLRVFRKARLPPPVLQHRIRDGRRTAAVVDFAYPAARIAIEAEGYRWHSSRLRWERDLARRNVLTALGWRIVHVTWSDLSSGRDQMIERLRTLLADAHQNMS